MLALQIYPPDGSVELIAGLNYLTSIPMPLPNGMPTAREISFEDWDHFVLLLAIKTFYEKKSKRKLRLADASAIFAAHDYAEKENAIGVIMIRDEEKKP